MLFVDLVGFTAASERRDAEETREALDRYFEVARTAVERHGGWVEKFIGDAVVAVWGAPTAHEDDAERAVRAALQVVEGVAELPSSDGPLQCRAAVTTGEASVLMGAADQAMVAGDVVNTAARLQSDAEAGTVLVDEATYRAGERAIVFEPVADVALRGRSLPVAARRAVRVVAGARGAGREQTLEPPFVGRTAELSLLKDLLHATMGDGRLRAVSITGQAGIGKSRLAWELEKYAGGLAGEVAWHHGRSPSYGDGLTFWALAEMVRRWAGIVESEPPVLARAQVDSRLDALVDDDATRRTILRALEHLLDLETDVSIPAIEKGELFAAWRLLFERIAEQGPTVLVFEDLHWGDAGLLDFIEHLLEWSRASPILVITLARPELHARRPAWGAGGRNVTHMHLEPLAPAEMATLLVGLVPGLDESAVRQLVQRAEGVPLYAVETVRMLLSDGTLETAAGGYRLTRTVDKSRIPETLQALVAARIDAVAPADRAVLQEAAVLGKTFTLEALAAVTGLTDLELAEPLRRLVRAELLGIETDPRSPERGQHGFLQALVREVAYSTLPRRERRDRHLAAARHFEALGDDELAAILAAHYDAARAAAGHGPEAQALAIQARLAFTAAAERAARLGGHEQSVAYFDRALELSTDPLERADIAVRAGDASRRASDVASAQQRYEIALEIYRAAGLADAELNTGAQLGHALCDEGKPREALRLLEEIRGRLATEIEKGEIAAARMLGQLGRAYFLAADRAPTMEFTDQAIALAERLDDRPTLVDAIITKGSMVGYDRPREGTAIVAGALDLARSFDLPEHQLRAIWNLSITLLDEDPARCRGLMREGAEVAARIGAWADVAAYGAGVANGLFQTLDWDGVLAEVSRFDRSSLGPWSALRLLWAEMQVLAFRGDADAVERLDLEREELRAQLSNPEYLVNDVVVQAWIRLGLGRFDDAVALARMGVRDDLTSWSWPCATGGIAALLVRDLDAAEDMLAAFDRSPARGRVVDAERLRLAGGIDALRGDHAGGDQLIAAARRFEELQMPFDRAMTLTLAAVLAPDGGQAVERAGLEARAGWESVGAAGFLSVVDRLLADHGPAGVGSAGSSTPPASAG